MTMLEETCIHRWEARASAHMTVILNCLFKLLMQSPVPLLIVECAQGHHLKQTAPPWTINNVSNTEYIH